MEFLLDDDVVFLNHGSFGACPREVFTTYQAWQARLERQPVKFLQRELPAALAEARATLAAFVGADSDEVVFVPNPTFAVNEIARSLPLTPADEVLMSDQEYGGCTRAWQFRSHKTGCKLVTCPVPLPFTKPVDFVDAFFQRVTDRTRLIFLSHITSPTALTLPVDEICRRARELGILTLIDGAHGLGQLPLDLAQMGADFYVATCHKWLCAPKGSAFLFARREVQPQLEPLVAGWGWGDEKTIHLGSEFLELHEWLGTRDPSAYLTVPTAIALHQRNDWQEGLTLARQRTRDVVARGDAIDGFARVHADEHFRQMGLLEILSGGDEEAYHVQLRERFQIEVPVIRWNDRVFLRSSWHLYNTDRDGERFLDALRKLKLSS